jgi:hypothetical protein
MTKEPHLAVANLQDVTSELQEGSDPYLCKWAEFYFLALMSAVAAGKAQPTLSTLTITDQFGRRETATILEKSMLYGVEHPLFGSEKRHIRLGQRTALVLTGQLKDAIVIPGEEQYTLGRSLRKNLQYVLTLHLEAPNNPYIQVLAALIREQLQVVGSLERLWETALMSLKTSNLEN